MRGALRHVLVERHLVATEAEAVDIGPVDRERAKQRMVRLTRRFGGVMSTVMVPTDYPVQPGDTIYVLERFF